MKPKALLLSCSTGGGHNSCAHAMIKHFEKTAGILSFWIHIHSIPGKQPIWLGELMFISFKNIQKFSMVYIKQGNGMKNWKTSFPFPLQSLMFRNPPHAGFWTI